MTIRVGWQNPYGDLRRAVPKEVEEKIKIAMNCAHSSQRITYTEAPNGRIKWTDYTCANCGARWRTFGRKTQRHPMNVIAKAADNPAEVKVV